MIADKKGLTGGVFLFFFNYKSDKLDIIEHQFFNLPGNI